MDSTYLQLGYVTNDFERAIELVRQSHGLGAFKEMRDLTIGARGGQDVTAHFGLAFKAGTEFEIIQPLAGDIDFYADVLPERGFAMKLHHMGHYYPDAAGYETAKAEAQARWPMPVDFAIFDGGYCYFDARAEFGHYLELYSFPAETHFEGVPRY